MAGRLIRTALRGSLNQVRYVTPTRPRDATGLTAAVYRQVERDFGMLAPPVCLHSPSPETMAAVWAVLRETLVVTPPGSAGRAAKEAVATGVSLANACPYCVEVHSATLGGLGVPTDDLGPESSPGRSEPGESAPRGGADPDVLAAGVWARESVTRDGVAATFRPFPDRQAAELIGVAVAFHYLNRVVNVFLAESPLPPRVPSGARPGARRFLGRVMRASALRGGRPGESVSLLAPAPPATGWVAGDRRVAEAFGRASAAFDGTAAVPSTVRDLVAAELSGWDGTSPGLSRAWVERAVSALPAADRSAGRLALLVVKASYQVDDRVVESFLRERSAAALVELVAWAAWSAAGRVGEWLGGQQPGATARAA